MNLHYTELRPERPGARDEPGNRGKRANYALDRWLDVARSATSVCQRREERLRSAAVATCLADSQISWLNAALALAEVRKSHP